MNPANSRSVGDLAESGKVHSDVGVDESAPSDTIVSPEECKIPIDTAICAVVETNTLPIAGGGTNESKDAD